MRDGLPEERRHGVTVGYVARGGPDAGMVLLQRSEARLVDVADVNTGALTLEGLHDLETNPAGPGGDQDTKPRDVEIHLAPR